MNIPKFGALELQGGYQSGPKINFTVKPTEEDVERYQNLLDSNDQIEITAHRSPTPLVNGKPVEPGTVESIMLAELVSHLDIAEADKEIIKLGAEQGITRLENSDPKGLRETLADARQRDQKELSQLSAKKKALVLGLRLLLAPITIPLAVIGGLCTSLNALIGKLMTGVIKPDPHKAVPPAATEVSTEQAD